MAPSAPDLEDELSRSVDVPIETVLPAEILRASALDAVSADLARKDAAPPSSSRRPAASSIVPVKNAPKLEPPRAAQRRTRTAFLARVALFALGASIGVVIAVKLFDRARLLRMAGQHSAATSAAAAEPPAKAQLAPPPSAAPAPAVTDSVGIVVATPLDVTTKAPEPKPDKRPEARAAAAPPKPAPRPAAVTPLAPSASKVSSEIDEASRVSQMAKQVGQTIP
jgi:hypothetical protein